MMKTYPLASALLACLALSTSCTTAPTTVQNDPIDPRQGASIGNRNVYTQEELQKRGQPTLGGALEAQDASIRVSGGR